MRRYQHLPPASRGLLTPNTCTWEKLQHGRKLGFSGLVLGSILLLVSVGACAADGVSALRQIGSIELPGPLGKRFDYLVIDYDDDWLFSAHLAAGQTYVIHLKSNQVLHTVLDTPGVEGFEYVPDERKIYTSNAGDNTIGVIDLNTMKVVRKIATEAKPDGNTYAAPVHKLYTSDERANALAVVDVRTDTVLTTLHFQSETGVPLYDPAAKRVYVNLQDLNELAVIDPQTDTVVGRYPVEGCTGNHGMALDIEHRRAFLACQGNSRLAVFDLVTNEIESSPGSAGVAVEV